MARYANLTSTLEAMGACDGEGQVLLWVRTQPDARTAWRTCERPDWLLWLTGKLRLSENAHRLIAADCAERALLREREAGREPDPRSWRAIEVARAHACGDATDEERGVAWDAARDAAWAAAASLVWDAAWAAAWAAARDATWDAAGIAANATAWATAYLVGDAARAAERRAQCDIIRAHISEDDVIDALLREAEHLGMPVVSRPEEVT